MKKIVIIPDSFKGTMSSREIGEIVQREAIARWPSAETVRLEVADGGEGSVDAFISVMRGEKKEVVVTGPYGERIRSFYGKMGKVAVVEMAAASGLPLVGENKSAGKTTTYGVGELILAALRDGAKKVILGLGGSATNDGGTGAAAALGVAFLNKDGERFVPVGETLCDIARIDVSSLDPLCRQAEFVAMCDIDNPLCGQQGAAAIFSPQKGATPAQAQQLEQGLCHLAKQIQQDLGVDVLNLPGGGAAGGLGAGAVAFLGAVLQSGIQVILDTLQFDAALEDCSLVITGEGRIDGQSAHGKVVAGVASHALAKGVPVLAIVGDVADDADLLYEMGVSAIFSINRVAVPYEQARLRAKTDLMETVRNIFRLYHCAENAQ